MAEKRVHVSDEEEQELWYDRATNQNLCLICGEYVPPPDLFICNHCRDKVYADKRVVRILLKEYYVKRKIKDQEEWLKIMDLTDQEWNETHPMTCEEWLREIRPLFYRLVEKGEERTREETATMYDLCSRISEIEGLNNEGHFTKEG